VEWAALEAKTQGIDPIWSALRVTCLLCVTPLPSDAEAALRVGLDAACLLPGADGGVELALGSLDLNLGASLPCEELTGCEGAASERAYLSNVCVAPGARRRGVARLLLEDAAALAAEQGVSMLYVHVAVDNDAAHALYSSSGFEQESEESADVGRRAGRPARRLLLRRLNQI
jgi:ribosomal protein S18 acetylase RimI-like enzyme